MGRGQATGGTRSDLLVAVNGSWRSLSQFGDAGSGAELRQAGEVAVREVDQPRCNVGEHQLGRVGHVGEPNEVAQLVQDDGARICRPTGTIEDLGELGRVERDAAGHVDRGPTGKADPRNSGFAGYVGGEIGVSAVVSQEIGTGAQRLPYRSGW